MKRKPIRIKNKEEMENKQRSTNITKQDNNNNKALRVTGSGLESLVLWGGALAVAGLISYFTIKKLNKKNGELPRGRNPAGLLSVLQPSPVQHVRCFCAKCAVSKLDQGMNSDKDEEHLSVIYGQKDEVPVCRSSVAPENIVESGPEEGHLLEIIGAENAKEHDERSSTSLQNDDEKESVEDNGNGDDDNDDDNDNDEDDDDDNNDDEDESEGEEDKMNESDSNEEKSEDGSSSQDPSLEAVWPEEITDVLPPKAIKDAEKQEKRQVENGDHLANNFSGNTVDYIDIESPKMVLDDNGKQELAMTRPWAKLKNPIWPLLVIVLTPILILLITSLM